MLPYIMLSLGRATAGNIMQSRATPIYLHSGPIVFRGSGRHAVVVHNYPSSLRRKSNAGHATVGHNYPHGSAISCWTSDAEPTSVARNYPTLPGNPNVFPTRGRAQLPNNYPTITQQLPNNYPTSQRISARVIVAARFSITKGKLEFPFLKKTIQQQLPGRNYVGMRGNCWVLVG